MSEKSFEAKFEAASKKFEAGLVDWVRNDRIFDGFRNTYARMLLAALCWAALYGYGLMAIQVADSNSLVVYPILILLATGAQKLSLRFVFDDDDLIDEYQLQRRNRAYRRAYKRVALILALVPLVWLLVLNDFDLQSATLAAPQLRFEQVIVFVEFVFGLFILQKYISWGFKGEPFRSKDEPND